MSWLLLWSCASEPPRYELTGTVTEVRDAELVIAHDPIEGFMPAMTMPFQVEDRALMAGVDPGDVVSATLVVGDPTTHLVRVEVTKEHERPPDLQPGQEVPVGAIFPRTPLRIPTGPSLTLGEGQNVRALLTFIYTRCPIPEYCPATVAKLAALQEVMPEQARLVAVTMDPEYDSPGVLKAYAKEHGAVSGKWDFGLVPDEVLVGVAEKAGLRVDGKGLGITHDLLFVVLDEQGRVLARYRDTAWDVGEVARLLQPAG
ncbi:MAG: copper-binding protein [Myxococcales bacterium]|nr:copper-binding protein [Myxococcales bacterium]